VRKTNISYRPVESVGDEESYRRGSVITQGDKSKGERGSYSNTDRLNGDLSAKKTPSKAKQR